MSESQETRTHTALHVLKGAAQKVLGTKWTAGVHVKGPKGRLTVQIEEKPTEEALARVEAEVNRKIAENTLIKEHEMERTEAEKRWGDWIYDLFPLPETITRLQILEIPDWNLNACKKCHTRTTGQIGPIRITKTRHRPSRNQLEISYQLQEP